MLILSQFWIEGVNYNIHKMEDESTAVNNKSKDLICDTTIIENFWSTTRYVIADL